MLELAFHLGCDQHRRGEWLPAMDDVMADLREPMERSEDPIAGVSQLSSTCPWARVRLSVPGQSPGGFRLGCLET